MAGFQKVLRLYRRGPVEGISYSVVSPLESQLLNFLKCVFRYFWCGVSDERRAPWT